MSKFFNIQLERLLAIADRYLERRKLYAIGLAVLALAIILPIVILMRINAFADQEVITSKAMVYYCTQGETADVCDPGKSLFSSTGLSNGISPIATIDNQPPSQPSSLAVDPIGTSTVTLNWSPVEDDFAVDTYLLDVALDSDFKSPVSEYSAKAIGNVTTITLANLQPGTTYYARVSARDASNNTSPASDKVMATTQVAPDTEAPATPSRPRVTSSTIGSIAVDWPATTDNTAVAGYRLEVATDDRFLKPTSGFNKQDIGTVTTATINQLTDATTYYIRIYAYDAAGNLSQSSPTLTAATQEKPDTAAPSRPSQLSASYDTGNVGVIEWTAATDNKAVAGYRLDVATDAQFKNLITNFADRDLGLAVKATVPNLDTTKIYYIRVTAYDAANNRSNATATIQPKPHPPVSTPSPAKPDTSQPESAKPTPVSVQPSQSSKAEQSAQETAQAVQTEPFISSVCFGFKLEQSISSVRNVLITAYEQDGRKVGNIRFQYRSDQMVVTDPRFVGSLKDKEYIFIIKADQHLAAKVVANPRQSCLATQRKLYFGDSEGSTQEDSDKVTGDNVIEPKDIVTVIRRRLRNELPPSAVVDVIRNRIRHAQGEAK